MRARGALLLLQVAMLFACGTYTPPQQPQAVRSAKAVSAGFDRTWNAVIDHFANNNIPISTLERASGFIATAKLATDYSAMEWADCGAVDGVRLRPSSAVYNVVVRGDSASSTVRVTIRFGAVPSGSSVEMECASRGIWEADAEESIAAAAEGRAPRANSKASTSPQYVQLKYVVALRSEPRRNSSPLVDLPVGAKLLVVRWAGDWVQVAVGADRGYVPADSVEPIR